MSINYSINADIVDIRNDSPSQSDCFLIDTNALYWMTYPRASVSAKHYQITDYPRYVNSVMENEGKIFVSGLSMAELIHLIEKDELKIYNDSYNKKNSPLEIKPKEFRHNYPDERKNVIQEIEAAWFQVKTLAEFLDITIDTAVTDTSLKHLQTQKVDGYDLFLLEVMKKHKINKIITDDGDFSTVPGIQVFTANNSVIKAAQRQNKILKR